jgi:hypothetical protein
LWLKPIIHIIFFSSKNLKSLKSKTILSKKIHDNFSDKRKCHPPPAKVPFIPVISVIVQDIYQKLQKISMALSLKNCENLLEYSSWNWYSMRKMGHHPKIKSVPLLQISCWMVFGCTIAVWFGLAHLHFTVLIN